MSLSTYLCASILFQFLLRRLGTHLVISSLTFNSCYNMQDEYVEPVYVKDLQSHQEGKVRLSERLNRWHYVDFI